MFPRGLRCDMQQARHREKLRPVLREGYGAQRVPLNFASAARGGRLFVGGSGYSFRPMSMVSREMVSRGLGFAFAVASAALGLGAPQAYTQSVPYWTSTTAFGSALTSDPNANPFGNFSSRYNFENGWFVGSERGNLGWGLSNFGQPGAFGNGSSFTYQGAQAGYNFKSAPVSVYAGFDTVKYNGPDHRQPVCGAGLHVLQHRARLWCACRCRNPPHLQPQPVIRGELLATAVRPQLRAFARCLAAGVRPPLTHLPTKHIVASWNHCSLPPFNSDNPQRVSTGLERTWPGSRCC